MEISKILRAQKISKNFLLKFFFLEYKQPSNVQISNGVLALRRAHYDEARITYRILYYIFKLVSEI